MAMKMSGKCFCKCQGKSGNIKCQGKSGNFKCQGKSGNFSVNTISFVNLIN